MKTLTITKEAAHKIGQMHQSQPNDMKGLRLLVVPGGCSGYMYSFRFDKNVGKEDTVIESHGSKLIVDKTSLEMLKGATIEYVESLEESGLKIKNPNAKSTCGCGSSFS